MPLYENAYLEIIFRLKKNSVKTQEKIKYPKSTDILAGVQSRGLQCSTGQFPLCQH